MHGVRTRAWVLLVGGLAVSACGGGGVCGDGHKDRGEDCDDGNAVDDDNCTNACRFHAPETLDATIRWTFNQGAGPRFDKDSCFDMHVTTADVEIRDMANSAVVFTASESCGYKQTTFLDIPAGTYRVRLSLRDTEGALMTTDVVEQLFTISSQDVDVTVNVPYEAWKNDYTGTFFFRLHWGAMGTDCGAASPPIARHQLTLARDGDAVTATTDSGDALDGTSSGACRPLGESFPQSVEDIPWGTYSFRVVGLDDTGTAQFDETFETFVGAGASNPEMDFVVGSLAVDAGPDGGGPDGGGPDGGAGGAAR